MADLIDSEENLVHLRYRLLGSILQKIPKDVKTLGEMVNGILSLHESLKGDADQNWLHEAHHHWWELEVIYAFALDENRTELCDKDIQTRGGNHAAFTAADFG